MTRILRRIFNQLFSTVGQSKNQSRTSRTSRLQLQALEDRMAPSRPLPGQISNSVPTILASDHSGAVFAGFGSSGVWEYTNNNWSQISTSTATSIVATENGVAYVGFGSAGLWEYRGGAWFRLSAATPELVQLRYGKVYVNFQGDGLWEFSPMAGWTQLSTSNATTISFNAHGDVFAGFGANGLWLDTNGQWRQISNATPALAQGNVFSFAGLGLWQYGGDHWIQLSTSTPTSISVVTGAIFASFGSNGFWEYKSGIWNELSSSTADVIGIDLFSGNVYVDFVGAGLWEYNGAWTQVSSDSATIIEPVQFSANGGVYVILSNLGVFEYQ
jgi:hypothetical protein